MPKAHPVSAGDDIGAQWGALLQNIQSAPTRALLKQWANPVKISPEETVLTMKNEIFLNQVANGNKKKMIIDALDAMFSQENSNVIIRLPLPDDMPVKAVPPRQVTPKVLTQMQPEAIQTEEETSEEEIEEAQEEVKPSETSKPKDYINSHSDMVNMVMDLFDGKIID